MAESEKKQRRAKVKALLGKVRRSLWQWFKQSLFGLALLAAAVVLRAWDPIPLQQLRTATFDLYQKIKPREITDRPVVIIDLDERSLEEVGQWPWPRTIVAELVSRLTAMGAIVIGFDVVFAEPDRMSPGVMAQVIPGLPEETRTQLESLPSNDAVLAAAIANSRVVLGQSVRPDTDRTRQADTPTTSIALIGSLGSDPARSIETYPALIRNIPEIDRASVGHGMFNVSGELDGLVRRVPMVLKVDDVIYPSLSAEMLRVATGNQSIGVRARGDLGIEGIIIRPNFIPTDNRGRVWVYFSHYDPEKYVSAVDILRGTVPVERIANKLVLIGTSATGLLDIKSTPLDPFLPGVEVHAQILENILSGQQLTRPRDADVVEVIVALTAGLAIIILIPLVGARLTVVVLWAILLGLAWFSWWNYSTHLRLYGLAYPMLTTISLYMLLTFINYLREEAQKRQVRGAFSRYMSPALVEKLADNPSLLTLGGEMRSMTLMFCDVRGFTTISEQFDAQGLTRFINRFLTPMTDVILQRQGTIDKYMGDCIMAFWNAPLDDDDHAANACRSALVMLSELKVLNTALEAEAKAENRKFIEVKIGIGLNTGDVCVGNMGSDQRFDYSVLGDNVNLASRLEGQSKGYGVLIVVGHGTRLAAPQFAYLELDLLTVKGKTEPVRIHALLGDETLVQETTFQTLTAAHEAMIEAYRNRQWDEASAKIAEARPLGEALGLNMLYDIYEERIADYKANPPPENWDGSYTATSK